MDSRAPGPGRRAGLRGRASECALLDDLVVAVRHGESRSLVLRGEAGIGKTALLECLVGSAADLTVVRAVGVESDVELAFASLHQPRTQAEHHTERVTLRGGQPLEAIEHRPA